jgi:hypothetical protein
VQQNKFVDLSVAKFDREHVADLSERFLQELTEVPADPLMSVAGWIQTAAFKALNACGKACGWSFGDGDGDGEPPRDGEPPPRRPAAVDAEEPLHPDGLWLGLPPTMHTSQRARMIRRLRHERNELWFNSRGGFEQAAGEPFFPHKPL